MLQRRPQSLLWSHICLEKNLKVVPMQCDSPGKWASNCECVFAHVIRSISVIQVTSVLNQGLKWDLPKKNGLEENLKEEEEYSEMVWRWSLRKSSPIPTGPRVEGKKWFPFKNGNNYAIWYPSAKRKFTAWNSVLRVYRRVQITSVFIKDSRKHHTGEIYK